MRIPFAFCFFLLYTPLVFCQSEFEITKHKKKIVIPFKLINNLIFIPVKVNGEELTFLLDTGVDETILFSLDESQQVNLFQLEKIRLKGLGKSEAIDAYKSSKNTLDAKGFRDENHQIYLVLDQEFNFSTQVGIPVNGIIGYHFFKNHKVEINYARKKIIVYSDSFSKINKQLERRFFKDSISIEENKPYYLSYIEQEKTTLSKLLLDTGNSDALWVFLGLTHDIVAPQKTIHDFIGRGFSGEIFGLRGRVRSFNFANQIFKNPIVTFPDSLSTKSVNFVNKRIGSIGGEVLTRFTIVFDYKNSVVYSKPNNKIGEPFNFNMSGIEVEHAGLEWTKQTSDDSFSGIKVYTNNDAERFQNKLQIKFVLKPIFKIANIRPNSTAEKAGLKVGDRIIRINGQFAHSYSIQKINELLKSEEGKTIEMEIERNNRTIEVKFELKSIL